MWTRKRSRTSWKFSRCDEKSQVRRTHAYSRFQRNDPWDDVLRTVWFSNDPRLENLYGSVKRDRPVTVAFGWRSKGFLDAMRNVRSDECMPTAGSKEMIHGMMSWEQCGSSSDIRLEIRYWAVKRFHSRIWGRPKRFLDAMRKVRSNERMPTAGSKERIHGWCHMSWEQCGFSSDLRLEIRYWAVKRFHSRIWVTT